jgi:hypothetical protein
MSFLILYLHRLGHHADDYAVIKLFLLSAAVFGFLFDYYLDALAVQRPQVSFEFRIVV